MTLEPTLVEQICSFIVRVGFYGTNLYMGDFIKGNYY